MATIELRHSTSVLREAERWFREQISRAHGSPFIAHYDLPDSLRPAPSILVSLVGGDVYRFLRIMDRFPCFGVWMVATAVGEQYGAGGDIKVYQPIAKRLALGREIAQSDRTRFSSSFKDACRLRGLALPPKTDGGRMVDDYLFQAGVSRSQLKALAQAFLRAEQTFGLPPEDDTRRLNNWEDAAAECALPGLQVLRRILKEDAVGFHATSFFRLRDGAAPTSAFEEAFQKAITDAQKSSGAVTPSDVRPRLAWGDGELRIVAPPGLDGLAIRVGGSEHRLRAGQGKPLPSPWPSAIEWCTGEAAFASTEWRSMQIFGAENRILVFDGESGARKCELDPTRHGPQIVPGGSITLIGRSPFQVNNEDAHPLGHDAFVLFCDALNLLCISQSDICFKANVDLRPHLEIDGTRIARNRDGWLIAAPKSVAVRGEVGDAADLEIRLTHPSFAGEKRSEVTKKSSDELLASLDLPQSGPFGMARVSLHKLGQERALYRHRFWFWPSLVALRDSMVFEADHIPENLAKEHLRHIVTDASGRLVLRADEPYIRAHLSFNVDQRIVGFDFEPPGISLFVRRSDGSERALKTGSSLIVKKEDYASYLGVRCDDPSADLDVKGKIVRRPFEKLGVWRAPFAVLASQGAHNRVLLLPEGRRGNAQNLVCITSAAEPVKFSLKSIGPRRHQIDASFTSRIDAVRIEAEDLIGGALRQADAALGRFPVDNASAGLIEAESSLEDALQISMVVDGRNYEPGLWHVALSIREEGRDGWMPVVNAHGDSYAIGFASEGLAIEEIEQSVQCGDVFLKLSRVVATKFAKECWDCFERSIRSTWKRLGKVMVGRDVAVLLRACYVSPPDSTPASWVPIHHPIEIHPELFAAPAVTFAGLGTDELETVDGFDAIARTARFGSLVDAAQGIDVSGAFLMGFENAAISQINPDVSPGAFGFERYRASSDWIREDVSKNKLLSDRHHRRCCERFIDGVERVTLDGAQPNGWTASAFTLVQRMAQFPYKGLDYLKPPEDLDQQCHVLRGAVRFLSLFAKASRTKCLNQFWRDISDYTHSSVPGILRDAGFVLRLAPELLAFYLLLWELVERSRKDG